MSRVKSSITASKERGVGWTKEGVEKYNELFDRIYEDRKQQSSKYFYSELAALIKLKNGKEIGKKDKHTSNKVQWVRPRNELQM